MTTVKRLIGKKKGTECETTKHNITAASRHVQHEGEKAGKSCEYKPRENLQYN